MHSLLLPDQTTEQKEINDEIRIFQSRARIASFHFLSSFLPRTPYKFPPCRSMQRTTRSSKRRDWRGLRWELLCLTLQLHLLSEAQTPRSSLPTISMNSHVLMGRSISRMRSRSYYYNAMDYFNSSKLTTHEVSTKSTVPQELTLTKIPRFKNHLPFEMMIASLPR